MSGIAIRSHEPSAGAGGMPRRVRLHPLTISALVFVVSAIVFLGLADIIRDRASRDANAVFDRAAVTVENWFDRYRALPELYARNPLIADALEGDPAPGSLDRISAELASWDRIAGTLDTYLLRPDGMTVAASNWQEDHSFVGQNFSFRPYFSDAMDGHPTGFFGLGTMSGKRGYYLSAPVRRDGRILGVVVVKVSIGALEEALEHGPHTVFVTDTAGVAIISAMPGLRMTATAPIGAAERAEIVQTRRYDLDGIAPSGIEPAGTWGGGYPLVRMPATGPRSRGIYLDVAGDLPRENWRLHLLYDLAPFHSRLWSTLAAVGASAVAAIALLLLVLQRRRRLIERLFERERNQATLERRVAQRTRELTEANSRLNDEVAERRAAEDQLRQAQTELVQAGKLAALGQMSAALSHEFNQPLTAIRTYTENAAAFYEAGRADRASENLTRVLRLTEKVAQLSRHLTRFARRSGEGMKPVALDPVISEALGLLAARIDRSGAAVRVRGDTGTVVMGGATRLQHVLMNLVTNAIDAADSDHAPEIEIAVEEGDETVAITVSDNGTGIAEDVLPQIFDPFFTTKEVGKGLGLGLSICFNIIKDFGGSMTASNSPGGGARFSIQLTRGASERMAAE